MARTLLCSFFWLACACQLPAQNCTQANIAGSYAIASQFMTPGPDGASLTVPAVSLAVVSVADNGAISGTGYRSMSGQVSPVETLGVIKVSEDCTAEVDWGQGVIAASVIFDESKGLVSVVTNTGQIGPQVVYATWKRITGTPAASNSSQCGSDAPIGTYRYRSSGFLTIPSQGTPQPELTPAAMLGLSSIKEDGTASVIATGSLGGEVVPLETTSAERFVIKPDCTAAIAWDLSSKGDRKGSLQHFAVVFDGGKEIWGIQLQNPLGPPTVLDTWTRMSTTPMSEN